MKSFHKLFCALMLIMMFVITGCKNPLEPELNSGSALFVNESDVWVTLILDGQTANSGMRPGDVWIKKELVDGTRHTYTAHATDPRVFQRSGSFDIETDHTEPYDIYKANKVVHIR